MAILGIIVERAHQPRDWIEGLDALIDTLTVSPEQRAVWHAHLARAAATEDPADIAAVMAAIQTGLPPYCTLSTHPDDPTCLGVWIDWTALERDLATGTLTCVDHLDHAPSDRAMVLVVRDTRSTAAAALYRRDGSTWTCVWAVGPPQTSTS